MSGMPSPSPVRSNNGDRDKDSMWYFTSEDLANSPSRRNGISPDQELSYRQMTAYLIQEMGQRLQVSQLCINTAIVYMHRFYAFHSFTHFHRNGIAAASLFLAAKVEEQPRKLEHVIKAANKCLSQPTTSTTDSYYIEQAQDLVFNENVLLQTLGFDVAIDHPHTHVVKTCHLVKACKDLAQTSYFLASNSLHLTSMCLQYKPTVVACFCIYLACKWSRWEIPQSTEGKHWFHYVDETVTMDLLKKLTDEFIAIYEKSPARLKAKLNSIKALAQGASNRQGQVKEKKADQDWKMADMMKMYQPAGDSGPVSSGGGSSQSSSSQYGGQGSSTNDQQQQSIPPTMLPPPPHQPPQQMRKSDMHSSSNQHRSHHSSSSSSSSSSSHHPPKIGYTSGDVPDHKLGASHKQQQQQPPYGTNLVNRQRDHSSSSNHSQSMMAPSSKSSNSSSSRSSMANSLTGQQLSRPSSQSHSMDVNYHKSRDRNLPVPPGSHNMPPHGMSHKMAQKQQDSGRSLAKDHSGRMSSEQQQQSKQSSSSSSNKAFSSASSSSSSSSAQYGGNNQQMPPGGGLNQSANKLDTLHDMSRNMMHASRGGYNQPPPQQQQQPTNGPPNSLLNFHQQQQGSRHSSSSSSNNNLSNSSSLKHEQSKQQQQISVHMQQPTQTSSAHNHTQQIMPPEANYPNLSATQQHDLQQQQQSHAASLLSNNYCKIEPLQHSDDHSLPQFTTHNQNPITKTVSSMFSPDWNEKIMGHPEQQQQPQQSKQHQMPQSLNYNNNGGGMPPHNLNVADVYAGGYNKLTGNKESPPKVKMERDTPSKKEKNRSNSQQDPSLATGRSASSSTSSSSSATNQPLLKTSLSNKIDGQIAGLNELAGTSNVVGSAGGGGMKRPNDQQAMKSEDDILLRDSKIRKLDNAGDIGKHSQVVNGIETNPDLVRNLLKESLCPPSALLKTENSIITPSLQPPAELFEPSATTSTQNPSHNTSATSASAVNVLSGNSDVSAMETEDHGTSGGSGSKSEKKKKKDKHKHKEKDKDKSKDREERKKHKKDKDRHKDKERDRESDNAEHVKIKISKEKLESAGEPIGFKIKIPKDRITGDLSTQSATSHSSAEAAASHAPPVLKIKISKDKLDSYSSGSATDNMGSQAAHPSYSHGNSQSSSSYAPYGSSTHSSSSGTHTSSSSKKKDRDREKDRERDKDKKRQHDSSSKSNGGSSSQSMSASAAAIAAATTNGSISGGSHGSNNSASGGTTTQKSQYSSKF